MIIGIEHLKVFSVAQPKVTFVTSTTYYLPEIYLTIFILVVPAAEFIYELKILGRVAWYLPYLPGFS